MLTTIIEKIQHSCSRKHIINLVYVIYPKLTIVQQPQRQRWCATSIRYLTQPIGKTRLEYLQYWASISVLRRDLEIKPYNKFICQEYPINEAALDDAERWVRFSRRRRLLYLHVVASAPFHVGVPYSRSVYDVGLLQQYGLSTKHTCNQSSRPSSVSTTGTCELTIQSCCSLPGLHLRKSSLI